MLHDDCTNCDQTTIGEGNGSGLVLLDLSAAFDTIDQETLFNHLEKYVGISGDALKLITSIFLRTNSESYD